MCRPNRLIVSEPAAGYFQSVCGRESGVAFCFIADRALPAGPGQPGSDLSQLNIFAPTRRNARHWARIFKTLNGVRPPTFRRKPILGFVFSLAPMSAIGFVFAKPIPVSRLAS